MPHSIKRRTFLHTLIGATALPFLRPSPAQARATAPPGYTDDTGARDLSALHDNDALTGIRYEA